MSDKRRFMVIIIGFFLVVFAVNGVFMYKAFQTHPGVETENAYERGLAYNALLERAEAAEDLGWAYNLEAARGAETTAISIQIVDAGATPLQGLDVKGKAFWPVKEGHDLVFDLAEVTPGVYIAEVPLEFKGQWDFRFIIMQNDEPKGHYTERVLLQ